MIPRSAPPRSPPPTVIARTAWTLIWRVAFFFLAWGVAAAPFFGLAQGPFARWGKTNPSLLRLSGDAWVVVSLVAVTWLMARKFDRQPLRSVGLTFARSPRDFAGGVAIGIAWLALPLAVAWASGWIAPVDHGQFACGALSLAALATFVNVVAQQLLLCGYLYTTIRSHVGLIAAVALSAVFFSAYHAAAFQGQWLPALNVFLAATLFCLARELSGALWLPVGIHTAWNFLLGPFLGLTVSGNGQPGEGWRMFELNGPAWATGGSFGIEGSVIVTAATIVLIAAFVRVLRRGPAQPGPVPLGHT